MPASNTAKIIISFWIIQMDLHLVKFCCNFLNWISTVQIFMKPSQLWWFKMCKTNFDLTILLLTPYHPSCINRYFTMYSMSFYIKLHSGRSFEFVLESAVHFLQWPLPVWHKSACKLLDLLFMNPPLGLHIFSVRWGLRLAGNEAEKFPLIGQAHIRLSAGLCVNSAPARLLWL